jgi:phosphoglycerate dehydrogenase-like enzyme
MKPTARLINVARGTLLDQSALLAALQQRKIAGAALDVTDPEPLPAAAPLWKAPNLLITPHTSAISDRLWPRQTTLLLDLLERWFEGRNLFNQVDLHRGY